LAVGGAAEEGIRRLRQGLLDWQATGSGTYQTYYLGLLAEVLGGQGEVAEGLRIVEESLALARQTGEGLFEAELHRLHGELLLCGANHSEGEQACRRALDMARRSEARSLALRAAMSLARLRAGDDEARASLAEVYSGFTEGFETADLREAKALLDSPT